MMLEDQWPETLAYGNAAFCKKAADTRLSFPAALGILGVSVQQPRDTSELEQSLPGTPSRIS